MNLLKIIKERKLDPRILQILAIGTYAILAREISTFERPHYWTFYILIWGVILDLLVGHFVFKKIKFPYTPFVVAIATSLLIDTPHLWIYLISITIAILSKSFLTYKGRHLLNPANIGVVFSLLAFPGLASGIPKLFNLNIYLIAIFCIVGILVSVYARVFQVAFFWLISFSFFAFIRSKISGAPLEIVFLPMLAPTFFIFTFHMITDPMTTPKTAPTRFLFVFCVAAIDAYIRFNFIPFSNFYALTLVSLFLIPLLDFKYLGFVEALAQIKKSSLKWALPCLIALTAYRFISEKNSYQNDPSFHIGAEKNISKNESSVLFKQAQKELGLVFTAVEPDVDKKLAHQLRIQWVGPGVTVRDFNNDGWMDILLINSNSRASKNSLYINQHGQGFIDQAAEWKIDQIPKDLIPQAATPFDFNNDKKIDLLLTGPGCTHLYENKGQSFEDVSETYGLKDCNNSIVALPFDFNHDGWMDLYVARFFSSSIDLTKVKDMFFFGPDRFSRSTNGGTGTLYRNTAGHFSKADDVFTPPHGSWTWDVGIADIKNDGNQILVVGNDFGDDFYIKTDPTKFTDITQEITTLDDRSSMNVSFGYWNNINPQIFLTNIYIPEHKVRGNFLWQYNSDTKNLIDYQVDRKADHCAWPWGGLFSDFDLDGEDDLYVANGMITRSDKIKDRVKDPNFFKLMVTGQVPPEAWRGDSRTVFSYIDDQKDFAAFQRDCLFIKNKQTEQYDNKSLQNPEIDFWDGRAVAAIDYDNNGTVDMMISTQGSEYRFLKNQTLPSKNWIGLDLEVDPTKSMGARIKLSQGNKTKYHWYQNGKSGFLAFSDPRIHFGLSNDSIPVDIEINWSDKSVSEINGLKPGSYYKLSVSKDGQLSPVTH